MSEVGQTVSDRNGLQSILSGPEIQSAVPVCREAPCSVGCAATQEGRTGFFDNLRIPIIATRRTVVQVVGCHLVAVNHINSSLFASLDKQVWKSTRLIGKQQYTARSEVR